MLFLLSSTPFPLAPNGLLAVSVLLHKIPLAGNIWVFCTTLEKGPETICFLFSTFHSEVWRCIDTDAGGIDAWQKHLSAF